MSVTDDTGRQDEALDALIVAAFLGGVEGGPLPGEAEDPESALTLEDHRALDALGPDLAERIARGEWTPPPRPPLPGRLKRQRRRRGLTGSLHRGEDDGGLTEQARQEMERKVRELDEAEGEGDVRP